MKVRATALGFFGRQRYPGEEFDIDGKNQFSENWMERVRKTRQKTEEEPEAEEVDGDETEEAAEES